MVGGLTERELATATDSTPEYIAGLVAAGLLVAQQDGHHWSDVWRVRLLIGTDRRRHGQSPLQPGLCRTGLSRAL